MTRAGRILLIAVVASALPLAAPSTAAACSTQGTGGLVTRTVSGRTYQLAVPAGLAPGVNVPLLVSFHGFGSSGASHADQTGWVPFAAAHGFITAFPDGRARSWQFTQGSPDVTFARAVVQQIRNTYCVDGTRIYAGGHSNGAYFAGRLGCDAADLFAAVAPYAGGDPGTFNSACTPSQPVAVGQFHGSADFVVPLSWGQAARDAWISRLSCSTTPTSQADPYGPLQHYGGCNGGVEVLWRVYNGQGHLWPTGAMRDDILAKMWGFFQTYTN
jgi:polyhydroxybutyrate depolymerase